MTIKPLIYNNLLTQPIHPLNLVHLTTTLILLTNSQKIWKKIKNIYNKEHS